MPSPTPTPDPSVGTQMPFRNPYGYTPTQWICYLFLILFFISFVGHVYGMFKYRLWWLLPTVVLGCGGEVAGWIGRLWSSYDITKRTPFMIQIVCTILSPTPFVAAIFMTFGHLVSRLGERFSWISAVTYARLFLSIDLISLLIQGGGGGIAAGAKTPKSEKLGSNLMLIGIIVQTVALLVFLSFVVQFLVCFHRNHPVRKDKSTANDDGTLVPENLNWNGNLRMLSIAIFFITFVLLIRAIYRTIELGDGWEGIVIHTEKWFNIFDGGMITLAVFTYLIFHPGRLMYSQPRNGETIMMEDAKASDSIRTV